MKILVTGIYSGLGKYLFENLEDSVGLNRLNFDEIKDQKYDLIVHCAFNKETIITDYRKYLYDNILLTSKLKELDYKKFIYISTIDVYNKNQTLYSEFKKLSETLMDSNDLILRCSMILGDTMKQNHFTRLNENTPKISLSKKSNFNYILMEEILYFIENKLYLNYTGVIDFVSKDNLKIEKLSEYLKSSTKFGDFVYTTPNSFTNPIWKLEQYFNKSSLEKIKKFKL